jgi:hypothetical protein
MPRITVVLAGEQLARLDAEAAVLGVSRSEALRRRLDETQSQSPRDPMPTRGSTLLKLEKAAAGGSVTAMATLARELRLAVPLEAVSRRERVSLDDLTDEELRMALSGVP